MVFMDLLRGACFLMLRSTFLLASWSADGLCRIGLLLYLLPRCLHLAPYNTAVARWGGVADAVAAGDGRERGTMHEQAAAIGKRPIEGCAGGA